MGNYSVAYIAYLILFVPLSVYSQTVNKYIREGNSLYHKKKYEQALSFYDKALSKKPESQEAAFNKADALYKAGKPKEAADLLQGLVPRMEEGSPKAQAYHNLGNAYLTQKKYAEAISAYKNALKINPKDEDTRYNLTYALKMLQNQQNSSNRDNQKQNQDNKQDQNQYQQQSKNDEKKDKNQDNQSDNSDKNPSPKEHEKQNKPNPNELKKEDAQRILEALNRQEKELQDKKRRELKKSVRVEIEKDW